MNRSLATIVSAFSTTPTVLSMGRIGKWFCMAALAGLLVVTAGCSGIHASKNISVMDFLMPGLIKNDAPAQPKTDTVAPAEPSAPAA